MSIRSLLAISCCLIVANESLAQYQQPAYQYRQQPMMNGAVSAPGMYPAAARMRQDQAMQAPAAPVMQAPVYQAPQNGFTAPPQLAPSMVAPSCGSNCMGHNSCDCAGGSGYGQGGCDSCAGGSQVGQDYFGCDAGCCESDSCCDCCSDRYLRVFGGWNWLQDVVLQLQTAQRARVGFNDGWAIGGAIGQYMTDNARRELEFTYRNNTIDSVFTPAPIAVDGVMNCYSLMGNLVYELPRLQIAGLKPYIGGGVGVAYVDGEAIGFATVDDTVFAYQGFFGMDRQLSGQAKLFAEYRYFGTSEFDIEGPFPGSDEYQANNLFFGLQISR